jgi:hypothetical protein
MEDAFAAHREQQSAPTQAYEAACTELGLGTGSLDVWKKERLARIFEVLAGAGDLDWASVTRAAVSAFLSELAVSPAGSNAH